jgi:hypothetical protein
MSAKIRRRYSVSAEDGFGGFGDFPRIVGKRAKLCREGDDARELDVRSLSFTLKGVEGRDKITAGVEPRRVSDVLVLGVDCGEMTPSMDALPEFS